MGTSSTYSKCIPWSCICYNESLWIGPTSPRPRYPAVPSHPKGVSAAAAGEATEAAKAVFDVGGMTCSACAGSVEKAIKRLPGIREAAVDVLNNKALVLYYPNFVNVSLISLFDN